MPICNRQASLAYRYFYAAEEVVLDERFRFSTAGVRFFQLFLMEQIRFVVVVACADGTGLDAGAAFDTERRVRMAVRRDGARGQTLTQTPQLVQASLTFGKTLVMVL